MSSIALRIESLGKQYRIGSARGDGGYRMLREVLTDVSKIPFRIAKKILQGELNGHSEKNKLFWALQDISFEVKQGEILGIIGHNGAGKSTLLKILSRVTEPTTGRAQIFGRVGSLLEVGTGFHWELTGRENIYLNGAILGMKKVEIDRKFDEIVAFSEVEEFLDTPVKRYSSGMYVRLAFAVAAHLEPEILLVDEVLAVGDAAFQQKCLGKMGEVGREGRTVLYVSHNLLAMEGLCDRLICLRKGRIESQGEPAKVISGYLRTSINSNTRQVWEDPETAPGNAQVRLHSVRIRPAENEAADSLTVRTPFSIEVEYWNLQSENDLYLSVALYNEQGILVFDIGRVGKSSWPKDGVPRGLFRDRCHVPGDFLNDGLHRIDLSISKNENLVYFHPELLYFDIQDSMDMRETWYGKWPGVIRPLLKWETELIALNEKYLP